MLQARTFDELNEMVGMNRSESFEDYFDVMDISEEEKEKRISLAERLEDNFLFVLAFLFTMQQYEQINWETIKYRFETAYRDALNGVIDIDDYLDDYIVQFANDAVEVTQSHIDDPYYYSQDRARLNAENESNSSWNYSDYADAIRQGKTRKQWRTMRDKKVRESHSAVEGKTIPITDVFYVGGSFFRFPKDSFYSPNAADVINCRCSIRYL